VYPGGRRRYDMCRLASFVVTRERVYWHPSDDGHETIIKHFHLDDDGGRSNFVRVELTPPDMDYTKPFKEWEFSIDQPDKPSWFSAKTEEEMVRAELPKWRKKRQFFFDAIDFVQTIKDVRYFSGKGKTLKAWKVFPIRAAAWVAARDAAGDAAWVAARDAAWDAAGAAAWAAARDAALLSRCTVVADKLDKKYMDHARARWSVWQKGYGLMCDIGGVFYVYRKP
jgi:hypothetical protein